MLWPHAMGRPSFKFSTFFPPAGCASVWLLLLQTAQQECLQWFSWLSRQALPPIVYEVAHRQQKTCLPDDLDLSLVQIGKAWQLQRKPTLAGMTPADALRLVVVPVKCFVTIGTVIVAERPHAFQAGVVACAAQISHQPGSRPVATL